MRNQIDFHDGFVDGLHMSESTARIFLKTLKGEKFSIVLGQVDALHVDNFKQGNIILDLTFLSPDQLDSKFVFETYGYSDEHKKLFVLKDWVSKANERGLTAIQINPSYGCSLSALFRSHVMAVGQVLA